MAKSQLNYEPEYSVHISRLFIFRGLWIWVMVWPLIVWAVWIGVMNFLHFWYMLILGKRNEALWKKNVRFVRHLAKWNAYFQFLVDQRPKFVED